MTERENYTGIDYFRLIAALLIVAIHTSPLADYSKTGDFILSRIIARTAVPFFFMTSGFFVVTRYSYDAQKLLRFVKRTAIIYGAAMLLYLPLNIYNGYFDMEYLLPNIIKDIVFDGTMYHLWYLPASILGAVTAWYLVKKVDYKRAFLITSVLYLIGLFGDSYYKIAERASWSKRMYDMIFQVSDYTRNGIFFAPVFFVIGAFLAAQEKKLTLVKSLTGFGISFALLFAEAMTLRFFKVQRHDSMYVFLLPCVYFLFCVLLNFRGKQAKRLKTASLLIYMVHPMVIVGIRFLAKALHLEKLLIENSMVHYIAVCLVSVLFGFAAAAAVDRCRPKKDRKKSETERTCVEIDLDNLRHNAEVLKAQMPSGCELMAVVKAEAYGHGAFEISTCLERAGVRAFAAATLDEGIKLRKYGVRGEILILGYTDVRRASELKKYDLSQTLIDYPYAKALNRTGIAVKAHIKIDTGMHRLGIPCKEVGEVKTIFGMKNIKVCGMFTHLCCSQSRIAEDVSYTKKQIADFYELVDDLKNAGIRIPKLHIQSSYGLLNYPEIKCDYVRAGIALYGVYSSPDDDTKLKLDLRPVLSLKSKVVLIRSIEKGESVGYDRKFRAERDSKIAILPVGYADGFPRNLSCGKGNVIINRCRVPIVGRICMDQLAVDITDSKDVRVGDIAILIGTDGETGLSADIVAEKSESISNELLSRIGARLPVKVRGRY